MPTQHKNVDARSARIDRLVKQQRRQNANSAMQRGLPWRPGDVSPPRTTPEDGDIVVRKEKREATVVYVLHTAPGADQYLLRTHEEAIAQALASATRQHVRAWLTDEGYDFVLLEDFRIGAGRDDIFISAEDLRRLQVSEGTAVRLRSASGIFRGRLKLAPIKPGNLEVHWPEGNTLLSGSAIDPDSMEPDFNAFVTIDRAEAGC